MKSGYLIQNSTTTSQTLCSKSPNSIVVHRTLKDLISLFLSDRSSYCSITHSLSIPASLLFWETRSIFFLLGSPFPQISTELTPSPLSNLCSNVTCSMRLTLTILFKTEKSPQNPWSHLNYYEVFIFIELISFEYPIWIVSYIMCLTPL